jgi:hypothetical protein
LRHLAAVRHPYWWRTTARKAYGTTPLRVPRELVSELLVIVAICLLVFGAERLPDVARTLASRFRRHTDRSGKPD